MIRGLASSRKNPKPLHPKPSTLNPIPRNPNPVTPNISKEDPVRPNEGTSETPRRPTYIYP